jgi:hypothetical protein
MQPARDLASASIALAAGIVLISAFLGLRQLYEKNARGDELDDADRLHFRRQDRRRFAGIAVLLALAAVVLAGSRLQPRQGGKVSLPFLATWSTVLALLAVLLFVALLDCLATRAYATRHRRRLLRDQLEAIRQESERRGTRAAKPSNGPPRSTP